MPDLGINIIRVGDDVPWPDLDRDALVHLPDSSWQVAIMERGMNSGLPSIALRILLPDGNTLVAETSLALWSSVTIAGRAAFPEAFEGGPLAPDRTR